MRHRLPLHVAGVRSDRQGLLVERDGGAEVGPAEPKPPRRVEQARLDVGQTGRPRPLEGLGYALESLVVAVEQQQHVRRPPRRRGPRPIRPPRGVLAPRPRSRLGPLRTGRAVPSPPAGERRPPHASTRPIRRRFPARGRTRRSPRPPRTRGATAAPRATRTEPDLARSPASEKWWARISANSSARPAVPSSIQAPTVAVGLATARLRDAPVGDVADQDVVEQELPFALDRRRLRWPDQALGDQPVDPPLGARACRVERARRARTSARSRTRPGSLASRRAPAGRSATR